MAVGGRIPIGPALFTTMAIVGVGYSIMALTTPNEEEFYAQLSPDLKRKVDEHRKMRKEQDAAHERLQAIKVRFFFSFGFCRCYRSLTPLLACIGSSRRRSTSLCRRYEEMRRSVGGPSFACASCRLFSSAAFPLLPPFSPSS